MCVSGVRNVSFWENFAYTLNEWPLWDLFELKVNNDGYLRILHEISFRRGRKHSRKRICFWADCCVHRYQLFKSFWDAPIRLLLVAKHEDETKPLIDYKFAVLSVNTNLVTVGPLSQFMSKFAHFFIKEARNKNFEVYSADPEQGFL